MRSRANNRPRRPPAAAQWMLAASASVALVAVAAGVWAVGRGGENATAPVRIDHVHGLGINPADGVLYVAAHNGVFRLPSDGAAHRVGDGHQDTMGFTINGPNHFLASGHPSPEQGGPAHLGLIESTDGGVTWQTLSLRGEADFHALRYRHGIVYGYNSVNRQLMVSHDRLSWETRSKMVVRDFVVSPLSLDTLLATTETGVVRSSDGGRTWAPVAGRAVMLLDWQQKDRLWGMTAIGEVLRSGDGGTSWTATGQITGTPAAFAANGDDLYASVHERGILYSGDGGVIWTQLHP